MPVKARKAASKHRATRSRKQAATPDSARTSKQSRIIEMMQAPNGTTIDKIIDATGWQKHSVRGFLSAVVRKKLKLRLSSALVDGDRVYTISNTASRRSRHAS